MALLSHMARLGSSEPFEMRSSMDELIEGFDITKFGAAPTKFDVDDLYPLTGRYLNTLPLEAVASDIAALGVPADLAETFWNVTRENITTRKDLAGWWEMYRDGAEPLIDDEDREFVAQALALLPEGPYSKDSWGEWTAAVKEATGRKGKGLFMPLRKALTGQERGPDMSDVMTLLQTIRAKV